MTWLPYALISAAAAAATAILVKIGIQGVPSNLATAIRTVVILVFAWAIAVGHRREQRLRDRLLHSAREGRRGDVRCRAPRQRHDLQRGLRDAAAHLVRPHDGRLPARTLRREALTSP
jgi:hypothetical protein